MEDSFGKVIAILICAYLMFIAPVSYIQKEVDKTTDTYILNEITIFVEQIQNTGIIDSDEYIKFVDKLTKFGEDYDIDMTHCGYSYEEYNGTTKLYNTDKFTDDILKELEKNKIYYLHENDYFKVTVKKNNSAVLFYGGGIKYEAY